MRFVITAPAVAMTVAATSASSQNYNVISFDGRESVFNVQNGLRQPIDEIDYTGDAFISRIVAAPGREELFAFGHSDSSSSSVSNPQILRVDPLTGSTSLLATVPTTPWADNRFSTHRGIAYNEADNVIYTLTTTSFSTSELATTDLDTGITTSVVELQHRMDTLGPGSITGLTYDNATGELFTLVSDGLIEDDFVTVVDPVTGTLDSLFSVLRDDPQDIGIDPVSNEIVITLGATSLWSFDRSGNIKNTVQWNTNVGQRVPTFAFVSTSVPAPGAALCFAATSLIVCRRRR